MSERLHDLRPEHVCLIKPSSLGDVVHALPVLSALRARWPRARIAWVVNAGLRGLLDGHPDLDEVIPFERAKARLQPAGIATMGRFLADLRRRRFDLAIDLQGLLRSGIMAAATAAPVRVGLASAREGSSLFYTHRTPPALANTHAVIRLMEVARLFGAGADRPRFVVAMTEDDRRWARSALAQVATPRLVLNLGARWPTKRWPPRHFATVARRAVAHAGAGLVVVGAREDRGSIEQFQTALGLPNVLDLCGETTLPQLAAVAAESDLFLSNDTGPLHLAAAAGARVIGIYTCTSPEKTGPFGPKAIAVRTNVWCAARCLKRCERLECMDELSPDHVWPVVLEQLKQAGGLRPSAA